jgi:hypothetical protein
MIRDASSGKTPVLRVEEGVTFEKPLGLGETANLFFPNLQPTRGILSRQMRAQVERVVLVHEREGKGVLGYPILFSAHLMPIMFESFPNAEHWMFNGIGQFIKGPKDKTFNPQFGFEARIPDLQEDDKKTVLFYLRGHGDTWLPAGYKPDLAIIAMNFGSNPGITFVTPRQDLRITIDAFAEAGYAKGFENQMALLSHLGFESLPEKREDVLLTPDRYSSTLAEAVDGLEKEIPAEMRGKPIIFLNPLKHMEGEIPIPHIWPHIMRDVAQDNDAVIVVNKGIGMFQEGNRDFEEIRGAFFGMEDKKARLVNLNLASRKRFFAMLGLVRRTGGVMIGIETGGSHAAGWMDVAQIILLPVEGMREYVAYLQERENVGTVVIPPDDYTKERVQIKRQTKQMIDRNKGK